ncbi:MAG: sulfatase [Chloroflexia bacterium]|nr:sulfatase [Chloroflexia bacterium]
MVGGWRAVWVVTVLAVVVGLLPPGQAVAARPPNIVVVVTDDMRASDWQALPETQQLLARGTTFPNFFLTTPTCCPSRTSILTGQYVHNHGVLTNEDKGAPTGGISAFRRLGLADDTIAHALGRAGYRTAIVGKFLNGYKPDDPPVGEWDRWVVPSNKGYTDFALNVDGKPEKSKGYLTDVLRDEAVRFIAETADQDPLFLYFAPRAPHGPATPAARHRDAFRNATVARTTAFNAEDLSDKPAYVQRKDRIGSQGVRRLDELERQRLASLLAVDEAVAAIWAALDAAGRLDNTYVFILSDNGYLMGGHRLEGKGAPYDGSVRVPMLAWGPRFERGTDERLVANIDIAPTIAQVAGVALRAADGQSVLDLAARDAILLERFKDGAKPTYTALRTDHQLYVEYTTGERELYDHRRDPLETNNLLADANEDEGARSAEVDELSRRLAELAKCKGAGCRTAGTG